MVPCPPPAANLVIDRVTNVRCKTCGFKLRLLRRRAGYEFKKSARMQVWNCTVTPRIPRGRKPISTLSQTSSTHARMIQSIHKIILSQSNFSFLSFYFPDTEMMRDRVGLTATQSVARYEESFKRSKLRTIWLYLEKEMMLTAIWDSPMKIHPYSLSHYSLTHSRSSAKGNSFIPRGGGWGWAQPRYRFTQEFQSVKQGWFRFPEFWNPTPPNLNPKKPHSHGAQSIGDHKKKNTFKFSKTQGPHCRPRFRWWANSNFGSHRTICDVLTISYGGLLQIDIRNNYSDAPPAE